MLASTGVNFAKMAADSFCMPAKLFAASLALCLIIASLAFFSKGLSVCG